MTLRLYFRVSILLVMTLISIQHPMSVINSDVYQSSYPGLQASKYKEKENRGVSTREKWHVLSEQKPSEISEDIQDNANEIRPDVNRNKRLETEDGVYNEFYKPINEETKPNLPLGDKEGTHFSKDASELSDSAKLAAAKIERPHRQLADYSSQAFGQGRDGEGRIGEKIQSDDSFDGDYTHPSKSVHRIGRDNYDTGESAEINCLRPETVDTLKKINPLTIGDQVSQMIHERKWNSKSRLGSKPFSGSDSLAMHTKDQAGLRPENDDLSKLSSNNEDKSLLDGKIKAKSPTVQCTAQPRDSLTMHTKDQAGLRPENDDLSKLSSNNEDKSPLDGKVKAKSPTVQCTAQPRADNSETQCLDSHPNNKFGFSVIIIAGDPLKLDELKSSNCNFGENNRNSNKGQHYNTDNDISDDNRAVVESNHNDKVINLDPHHQIDDSRVERDPKVKAEFPVYDQDLPFTPDPLHGLFEPHYGAAFGNNKGSVRGGADSAQSHRLRVRDARTKYSGKEGDNSIKQKYVNKDVRANRSDNKVFSEDSRTIDLQPFGGKRLKSIKGANGRVYDTSLERSGEKKVKNGRGTNGRLNDDSRSMVNEVNGGKRVYRNGNKDCQTICKAPTEVKTVNSGKSQNGKCTKERQTTRMVPNDVKAVNCGKCENGKGKKDGQASCKVTTCKNFNENKDQTTCKTPNAIKPVNCAKFQNVKGNKESQTTSIKPTDTDEDGDAMMYEDDQTTLIVSNDVKLATFNECQDDRGSKNVQTTEVSSSVGGSKGCDECLSWRNNNTDSDGSDDSDIELFGDVDVDKNKTCCISWKRNKTSNCDVTTTCETTETTDAATEIEECGVDDQGLEEVFGDLLSANKTCCLSWREPEKSNSSNDIGTENTTDRQNINGDNNKKENRKTNLNEKLNDSPNNMNSKKKKKQKIKKTGGN